MLPDGRSRLVPTHYLTQCEHMLCRRRPRYELHTAGMIVDASALDRSLIGHYHDTAIVCGLSDESQ